MPTKRARLTVTETPEVADRLDFAATRFPELAGRRRELLLRLAEAGEAALRDDTGKKRREEAKRRILAEMRAMTPEQTEEILSNREEQWRRDLDW